MRKIIITAVLTLLLLGGGITYYLYTTDHTPISHYWENYQSWYKTSGNKPITGDETRFLGDTHRGETGYRVIYINDIGAAMNKIQGPYDYPEGTVIVKEQYKSLKSYESGRKPQLTIMIKLAEGSSPETGDWGYVSGFRRKNPC